MRFRLFVWFGLVFTPLVVGSYGLGCFSTTSTSPTSTAGNGGSSTSSSGGGGSGGSGGAGGAACGADAQDCGDLCAGVTCKPGSYCNNAGMCVTPPSCAAGTDCGACTDFESCAACNSILYQDGWQDFVALRDCVLCTSCYDSCAASTVAGLMGGAACSSPPPSVDPCDSDAGCSNCSICATDAGGTCFALEAQCQANSDCTALLKIITDCPGLQTLPDGGLPDASGDAAFDAPDDAPTD